jgi:lysophospholipase L1-like esterase
MSSTCIIIIAIQSAVILVGIIVLIANRFVKSIDRKANHQSELPLMKEDIVFLGDSITEEGRWNEIYPHLPVKNRGIAADTTEGVLERLDSIVSGQPATIFLKIGTNDLVWHAVRKDEEILTTYEEILRQIKSKSPGTRVIIQSILPRQKVFRRRIERLNIGLKTLADRYEYEFLDLYPHFLGPDGILDPEFTNDGLHLIGSGYRKWAELLEPYLGSPTLFLD